MPAREPEHEVSPHVTKPAVPFLDLPTQQARIRDELRRRLDAVLAHCQFILGPEVAELEQCWRATKSTLGSRSFLVDVSDLTGVDDAGHERSRNADDRQMDRGGAQ